MSEHIKELARQVRRTTLKHLEAAQDGWLRWSPSGTSNHILWHAGHALWLGDELCIATLDKTRRNLPEGWADTFGMHCRPVASTTVWPTRKLVVDLLTEQLANMTELFDEHSEQLSQPSDLTRRIIHGFHDEAIHSGEMYLLLKMCKAN